MNPHNNSVSLFMEQPIPPEGYKLVKGQDIKDRVPEGAKIWEPGDKDFDWFPTSIREAFTKAVLDAVGYEFPKDEEREVFERWYDHISKLDLDANLFEAWKAVREELLQSLEARDAKPDQ